MRDPAIASDTAGSRKIAWRGYLCSFALQSPLVSLFVNNWRQLVRKGVLVIGFPGFAQSIKTEKMKQWMWK